MIKKFNEQYNNKIIDDHYIRLMEKIQKIITSLPYLVGELQAELREKGIQIDNIDKLEAPISDTELEKIISILKGYEDNHSNRERTADNYNI